MPDAANAYNPYADRAANANVNLARQDLKRRLRLKPGEWQRIALSVEASLTESAGRVEWCISRGSSHWPVDGFPGATVDGSYLSVGQRYVTVVNGAVKPEGEAGAGPFLTDPHDPRALSIVEEAFVTVCLALRDRPTMALVWRERPKWGVWFDDESGAARYALRARLAWVDG